MSEKTFPTVITKKLSICSNVSNLFDDFLVDFDSFEVNVGVKVLIMIVQQHWCVNHRREADCRDADTTKITRVGAAREHLNFRTNSAAIKKKKN